MMLYRDSRIWRIDQPSSDLKIFYFDNSLKSEPGQFVFAHINGDSEKPFSIADDDPLTLAVRKVGGFTSKLFELEVGDEIGIRGPYGKAFTQKDGSVLVGGGTGIAPINFLAKRLDNSYTLIGGRDRSQLIFLDELIENNLLDATTEDGSYGRKGLVTDLLSDYLKVRDFSENNIYACGPEGMMRVVADIGAKYLDPENIEVAVERYMKCGIGICGACSINGYRSCVDGPVFTLENVDDALGRYTRDKSGARVEL